MKAAATTPGTARHSRQAASRVSVLAAVFAGAWASAALAQGSGISLPIERPRLEPGIRASATWSDNILLAPDGQKESDTLIEVSPYVTAVSTAPRASYNLFYKLRNFYRVDASESNLFRHSLNANGSFAMVDDRLWVDLSAYMGAISRTADGPILEDPGASFVNTADVRRFSISPWYRDRLGDLATYQLRYALAHSESDADFDVARIDHRASFAFDGLQRGVSPWNWRLYGDFQRREFETDIESDRRTAGAMLFYRLGPQLRVHGAIEYEQIDEVVDSDGDNSGYGPGAGFEWTPSSRTNVSATVSRRYYGTVGDARATYSTRSSTAGLHFSRQVRTSSDTSLLLLDPAALTSGAAAANTVLPNLIASGIVPPTSTALTQGLFTDEALFERRLTGFWGLRGARNSLTFTGYISNRDSRDTSGSAAGGGAFSGELRERGIFANYLHRLDGRSSINVVLGRRKNTSTTAGFETRLTTLRATYVMQLTSDTAAYFGARRAEQDGSGGGSSFDETAVFAGVDVRFH